MKHYFYSESSFYGRHMLVKAAIVCVEGVKKKIQGEKLADALPYRICFKGSSSPGSAQEPLAGTASLMQHLGNWWTRAGHQLLLQLLIMAVRDDLLNCWGSSFLGSKAASWQLCCHLLLATHQRCGVGGSTNESAASSFETRRAVCVPWPCPHWLGKPPSLGHTHKEQNTYVPGSSPHPQRTGALLTSLKSAGRGCFSFQWRNWLLRFYCRIMLVIHPDYCSSQ